MACQFQVCQSQNLSLSLLKCLFFPSRLEFVGVDSCVDGNRPAQSKRELIKHWLPLLYARDVASFLGFINFYGPYIPYFEHRASALRDLAKFAPDVSIIDLLTPAHAAAREDLIMALLSDPCLARFDPAKRPYLLTDFSKFGFGYEIAQPDDDPASLAAMHREILGGDCEFLLPRSILRLRPTGFGSRRCRGKEDAR